MGRTVYYRYMKPVHEAEPFIPETDMHPTKEDADIMAPQWVLNLIMTVTPWAERVMDILGPSDARSEGWGVIETIYIDPDEPHVEYLWGKTPLAELSFSARTRTGKYAQGDRVELFVIEQKGLEIWGQSREGYSREYIRPWNPELAGEKLNSWNRDMAFFDRHEEK